MIDLQMLRVINTSLAVLAHGSFIWGALRFFRSDDDSAKRGKLLISVTGGVFTIANVFLTLHIDPPSVWWGGFASASFLTSIVLFWLSWSVTREARPDFAFSRESPSAVFRAGPYRYVRHPFYLSYLLAWFAACASPSHPLSFIAVAFFGILYWRAAKVEEQAILQSSLGEVYADYVRSTGFLWPLWRRKRLAS